MCASCYHIKWQQEHPGFRHEIPSSCHPERPHVAKGLCRACYKAQWRKGDAHARRFRLYGLTEERFLDRLEKQNGKCAICLRPEGEVRMHCDHDHATGRFRGLLCPRCNNAIAHLGDTVEVAQRLLAYLRGE